MNKSVVFIFGILALLGCGGGNGSGNNPTPDDQQQQVNQSTSDCQNPITIPTEKSVRPSALIKKSGHYLLKKYRSFSHRSGTVKGKQLQLDLQVNFDPKTLAPTVVCSSGNLSEVKFSGSVDVFHDLEVPSLIATKLTSMYYSMNHGNFSVTPGSEDDSTRYDFSQYYDLAHFPTATIFNLHDDPDHKLPETDYIYIEADGGFKQIRRSNVDLTSENGTDFYEIEYGFQAF